MRLAILADIHGNLNAFEAALADLRSRGDIDQIWCLGDMAALGGQPAECIARLKALQESMGEDKVKLIGGNTDRYLVTGERMPTPLPTDADGFPAWRANQAAMHAMYAWTMTRLDWDDFAWLRPLIGAELRLKVEGFGHVLGFHAIPGDDESLSLRRDSPAEEAADALLDREGDLALVAHTHIAMDRTVASWRVINPGSVGLSFGNPGVAEWALLHWREGQLTVDLRRAQYDVPATLDAWEKLGHPAMDWIAPRLRGNPA